MFQPPEDRFAGCLIGQCVGDAVGFMVEGCAAAVTRPYADVVLLHGLEYDKRKGPFALGQYSDDSQLARELIRSTVAGRGFDPEDYARRVAALFAEGRVVGGGWATAQAAERLASGVSWRQSGTPAPNAGNGSAMRAGPIGLMYFDRPEDLISAAREQGRITHADPRCSAGATAIAGAVALALRGEPIRPAPFLSRLADWAGTIETTVADSLLALIDWLDLEPADAVDLISQTGQPDFRGPHFGISPFVTCSVVWSLYAFLRTPDDYVRAIHTAIAVGGDVDTTAAMTGAVAGARNGIAAIPPGLANRLTDQGTWGRAELEDLARRLWKLKMGD